MIEETTSIKSIDELKPIYCTTCLICDETIEEYGDPICKYPVICDECKEAVKFAKWLKTGRTAIE